MLALKVVLAAAGSVPTLVFDEVDTGVGGATADAVGVAAGAARRGLQVLAVTHSPQVAARAGAALADHEDRRSGRRRRAGGDPGRALVPPDGRREEIARMLSGAKVTDEARAAAERLIAGAR